MKFRTREASPRPKKEKRAFPSLGNAGFLKSRHHATMALPAEALRPRHSRCLGVEGGVGGLRPTPTPPSTPFCMAPQAPKGLLRNPVGDGDGLTLLVPRAIVGGNNK